MLNGYRWGQQLRIVPAVIALALGVAALGCRTSEAEIDTTIERAKPLIASIEKYVAKEGGPPASLAALVPAYIEAIPRTGMSHQPHFSYHVGPQDPTSWRLSVDVKGGGMFRHMRYDPRRQFEIPVTDLKGGWVMLDP